MMSGLYIPLPDVSLMMSIVPALRRVFASRMLGNVFDEIAVSILPA